jgi:ABC-type dipeptide/oligopeptide/nickel transport system permease subunit
MKPREYSMRLATCIVATIVVAALMKERTQEYLNSARSLGLVK